MKLNERYESEFIIKGIRKGTYLIISCDPLAEAPQNHAFCPKKDECQYLNYILENPFAHASDLSEIILSSGCSQCTSDLWLLVAATVEKKHPGQSSIMQATCSEGLGRYIKEVLKDLKKKKKGGDIHDLL